MGEKLMRFIEISSRILQSKWPSRGKSTGSIGIAIGTCIPAFLTAKDDFAIWFSPMN